MSDVEMEETQGEASQSPSSSMAMEEQQQAPAGGKPGDDGSTSTGTEAFVEEKNEKPLMWPGKVFLERGWKMKMASTPEEIEEESEPESDESNPDDWESNMDDYNVPPNTAVPEFKFTSQEDYVEEDWDSDPAENEYNTTKPYETDEIVDRDSFQEEFPTGHGASQDFPYNPNLYQRKQISSRMRLAVPMMGQFDDTSN